MTDVESDSMIGNSSAGGETWVDGVERRSPPNLQDLMCLSPSKKNATKRRRGTETVGDQEESVNKSPRLPENELDIEEDDDDDGGGGVNL